MVKVLFVAMSVTGKMIVSYEGVFYVVPESAAICTKEWLTYSIHITQLTPDRILEKE